MNLIKKSTSLLNKKLHIKAKKKLVFIFLAVFVILSNSITPFAYASSSITISTDTDFNKGTFSSTAVSGTGSNAVVQLSPQSNWYDNNWLYRKKITIDHTKVPANQTNFPVLINLSSDSDLKANAQSSGNDILFTSSDGQTKLNHEIESYDSSTGALVAWVNVPALSSTSDTVLYLYFGNASASNQQNPSSVWDSNYGAVWHLGNNCGTSNCIIDSTSNGDTATPHSNGSTIGSLYTSSGQIDGAQSFNGANQYILTGADSSLNISTNILTISAWVKRASATTTGTVISHGAGGAGGYIFGIGLSPCTTDQFKMTKYNVADICAGSMPEDTNWHYVVEVADGTSTRVYVDGSLSGSSANTTNFVSDNTNLIMGSDASFSLWWNGSIDDARISSTNRSANWITTEYNNQNSPSSFYTLGSKEVNFASSGTWESASNSNIIDLGNGSHSWGDGSTGGSTAFSATLANISSNQTVQFQMRTASSQSGLTSASYVTLGTATSGTIFSLTKSQLDALNLVANEFIQVKVTFSQTNASSPQLNDFTIFYGAPPTPTPTPGPTTTPSSSSTTTSNNAVSPPNPNSISGWSAPIMAGPHFVGTPSYISGIGDASNVQTFIGSNAVHDDVNVSISSISPTSLADNKIPFPWAQGFNTAGEIFNFSVVSAFNGYPIQTFDKPVTIIIPYDPLKVVTINPKQLAIAMYNPVKKKWIRLPNTVINYQNHTLATTTTQFSYFVVVYPAKVSK